MLKVMAPPRRSLMQSVATSRLSSPNFQLLGTVSRPSNATDFHQLLFRLTGGSTTAPFRGQNRIARLPLHVLCESKSF